ncbi:hypothetical protein [Gimesia sp.]|uniref:hypothetical protein n=1 Tax=Gimesia sp. TaxID=2024833 RepID=UPI000C4B388B|nr:hypothetical protein [Gimesia sp.]MAX34961.1 hypothetical protein [Gimesia sp.]HAH47845.1 hypothetical protein [Planctomycetaceae bacterium]
MDTAQKWMCRIATLGAIMMTGCASTYHSYSGCQVDCQYCDPPPLSYTCYENCVCHSSQVSGYLERLPHHPEAADHGDNNAESGK